MLADPVLDVLLDLAQGGFGDDEAAACAMLLAETGIPGCVGRATIVDVRDHDGSSPLVHAVLCQRVEVSHGHSLVCTARRTVRSPVPLHVLMCAPARV